MLIKVFFFKFHCNATNNKDVIRIVYELPNHPSYFILQMVVSTREFNISKEQRGKMVAVIIVAAWMRKQDHINVRKSKSTYNLSLVLRKPVFGVSNQVRHKPGCTATEDG